MRVGVAFEVRERQALRHEALEGQLQVGAHRRVGVLVDGHAGGGVGHVDDHHAVARFAPGRFCRDLRRDVNEDHALAGLDLEAGHGGTS